MRHPARILATVASLATLAGTFALQPANAATVNAASCSLADVQSAILAARDGDTVAVPAGNCTWSGTLNLGKGIHLRGAGRDSTRITMTGTIAMQKHSTFRVALSGFSLSKSGGGNASRILIVSGSWSGAPPLIFDNTFTVNGSGTIRYETNGGVIFKNIFNGQWDDSAIQHKNDSGWESWTTADTYGVRDTTGTQNLYVEDNTFNNMPNQATDFDDAARIVFRYNTLNQSSFNSHGRDTSPIGIRHFEIYNNSFRYDDSGVNQNWQIWIRGGAGVIFNNHIANLIGQMWGDKPEISFSIRGAEDVRPQGSCSNVSYPVPHQIGHGYNGTAYVMDRIFMWNNTGNPVVSAGWNWGNPCGLNFSTFWQSGRDYAFNTQKSGYVPYTYPHPLRSSAPLPAPPTQVQVN